MAMIANMMELEPLTRKPGSVGKAVCGYDIKIFDEEGTKWDQMSKDMLWSITQELFLDL
jgi:acyl-coenzyme A synthetase/AMP-(fatty) acid ligase